MNLLTRRHQIITSAVNSSEQLIYSLSDYTCDGTVNTFIDTGIRLFFDYESFRIELEYDDFDLETQINNETILECKLIGGSGTIAPGVTVRAGEGSYKHKLRVALNPIIQPSQELYGNLPSATVSITYTGGDDNSIVVNEDARTYSGVVVPFLNTLTIGGRNASANTPDRFVSCHIISLKVYGTPIKVKDIYYLRDYTCDGTAATAINTGLYLFDTSVYPNGWAISFDFTVGENNVSQAGYLRCRNAASPYPGIGLRCDKNDANKMYAQVNSASKTVSASAGTRHNVLITNDLHSTSIVIDDATNVSSSTPTNVISPLVIGGELSNDTTQAWNTSRFGKIYIHSLIIRAI